jgi:hypothetical protein
MTREEAKQAAEYIMSKVPGIFAMGNSAITPLSIALLSTPGEIIHALDPLKRGDWRTLALNVIDFGSPAVGLFMAAMRSLYDRYSEGLGPEVERALGGFSRDYSLVKRLAEGGTQWFKYSPSQAIGARIFGSFFPRTLSGEGVLESLERDEARRAQEIRASLSPAERAYQDVFKVREQYRQLAVQHGLGDRLNEEIKTVFNRHAERLAERNMILERLGEDAYKTGTRSLSLDALRELTSADVRLLAKWGIISDEDAAAALNWIRGASEAELRAARMRAGNNEFREAYKAYYDARALLREEYGMSDYELPDLP